MSDPSELDELVAERMRDPEFRAAWEAGEAVSPSPRSDPNAGPFGACDRCGDGFAAGEVFESVQDSDRFRHLTCPSGYTEEDVQLVAAAVDAWTYIPDAGDGYPSIRMGSGEDMARIALGALVAAGRLLPPDARTSVEEEIQWRYRTGYIDSVTYVDYDEAAMAVELDAARALGSERLSWRKRTIRDFADGSVWVGPWVPVDPLLQTATGNEVESRAPKEGDD